MDIYEFVKAILTSAVAGGSYSLMFAISKINKGEAFEIMKFARTVILGCVIGVVAHFSGYSLTNDNYQAYVAANGFVVVVVDNLWTVVRNWYQNRK